MVSRLTGPPPVPGSGWHAGIGDPSWAGWAIVLAYAVAAALAWFASRACRSNARRMAQASDIEAADERRLAAFWLLACLVLTALGINKQLDLQSLLIQVLRGLAVAEGWYEDRRHYQLAFVVAIGAGGCVGAVAAAWHLRRVLDRAWTAVLGLVGLTGFVVVRAASFHHIDTFLGGLDRAGLIAFELSGIVLIAAGAGRLLWRAGRVTPARRALADARSAPGHG